MERQEKYPNIVLNWLIIGLIMVFVQVIIGGITRLTESGLSITKWEVVSGTLPPMSAEAWHEEFKLYQSTPQYKEINEGMSFDDFKFIYFWEYIHRFWARIMGFVFLIPFIFFYRKGYIDKMLLKNLGVVVFLAALAATFGWIMVASGLVDRPWVNAYKLSLHLIIAFSVYIALLWSYLHAKNRNVKFVNKSVITLPIKLLYIVLAILLVQVFFGGVLSGMKAAVVYPTWPDMHGSYMPSVLLDMEQWKSDNFSNYDQNAFMPALIHFLHRMTAYLLFILGSVLTYRLYILGRVSSLSIYKYTGVFLFVALLMQVLLGIITVLNSVGDIPVLWGVLHQAGALVLITALVIIFFVFKINSFRK